MAKKPAAKPAQAAPAIENIAPHVPAAPAPAPAPWATQPAAPAAPSAPSNAAVLASLKRLKDAKDAGGYLYARADEMYLLDMGLIEVSDQFKNDAGELAAIPSAQGEALLANVPAAAPWGTVPQAPAFPARPPNGAAGPVVGPAGPAPATAYPQAQPQPQGQPKTRASNAHMTFEIDTGIPVPERKHGGAGSGLIPRAEVYPFSKLEVGQSFHIPSTPENPNPAKTIGGTVNAANLRWSEEVPGQTRVNKRGNTVPVVKPLRYFVARTIGPDDNDPRGPGVRVFRLS